MSASLACSLLKQFLVLIRDRHFGQFRNSLPDRGLFFDGSGTALDVTERASKEANMVLKRGTKSVKSAKKVKSLSVKSAQSVKGGKRADGTGGGNVAGGWDLISNKKRA
jgi:hypothetical protein